MKGGRILYKALPVLICLVLVSVVMISCENAIDKVEVFDNVTFEWEANDEGKYEVIARYFVDGIECSQHFIESDCDYCIITPATCTSSGEAKYSISIKDKAGNEYKSEKIVSLAKKEHEAKHLDRTDPTFEDPGFQEGDVCANCGAIIEGREEIPIIPYADYTYKITFSCNSQIHPIVYDTKDYSNGREALIAYSRNGDSGEYDKTGDGQINFKLEKEADFALGKIMINGQYKNLKEIVNSEGEVFYRITKISSDLIVNISIVPSLVFSLDSGYYQEGEVLDISSNDCDIYYTTDGTIPTSESIKYEGPICLKDATLTQNSYSMLETTSPGFLNQFKAESGYSAPSELIDKCNIIRAIAIDEFGNCSEVITKTYFVGFDNRQQYEDTMCISLVCDPNDLFGEENGIYVMGANFNEEYNEAQWYAPYYWWWQGNYSQSGKSTERIVECNFFLNEEKVLTKTCGIRIKGNGSRGYIQKGLNFYARDEYDGDNKFRYNFFGTGYLPQRMTLYAGGDDYKYKIDDWLLSKTSVDATYAMTNAIRTVLFINGEFWGYYYLMEKYDDEYFEHYYDIDKDDVVLIRNGELEEGTESDYEEYLNLSNTIANLDMTDDDNYEYGKSIYDIQGMIDYYATMAYIARYGDWPISNVGVFKNREGGKYNFVMFDLNSGAFEDPEFDSIEFICTNDAVFNSFYQNEDFRQNFIAHLKSLAENRFEYSHICQLLAIHVLENYEQQMQEYRRFYDDENKALEYIEQIGKIKEFFRLRQEYIRNL